MASSLGVWKSAKVELYHIDDQQMYLTQPSNPPFPFSLHICIVRMIHFALISNRSR